MDAQLKETIRAKTKSYLARAEELKKKVSRSPTPPPPTGTTKTPAVAEGGNQDAETQQIMRKLEG